MKFLDEFKEFISRGNVVDMAVGVVVGGAFKSIIDSLVANIITPFISVLTGKVNIAALELDITETLKIPYGEFLQSIINFVIIAFSIFCAVKVINGVQAKFAKKKEEEQAPAGPTQEELLMEIRDLLKDKK